MNADRWREVSRIYGAVLTKPESDRSMALASLCANDAELRAEVESLLQSGTDAALVDRAATERPSTLGLIDGRAIGTQIGVFRIDSLLGVGGMGEVYRARDTKLNRDVAIKILPPAFASDPERLARFKREAQLLAQLNHPNIGAIHGFEDSGGIHALVLELVEGPTLADKLADGAGLKAQGLPIDEALAIARQICDALEAAHEQGIVHRDLKPANIKVREDGTVKVLDFGLAKIAETSSHPSAPNVTQSPTITTPAMTAAGMILGTAAYMSPEQAKGKPADKRSDVWAFGCVLFEMLTGRRAFEGEDVADTLANVLKTTPDLSLLPAGTPDSLRRILGGCLQRDRHTRVGDVAVIRYVLANHPSAELPSQPEIRRRAIALAGVAVAIGLGVAGSFLSRPTASPATAVRFRIQLPVSDGVRAADPIATPDGRRLVYVGDKGQLLVHELGQLDPVPLEGVSNARAPFVSPDGRWVGFFQGTSLNIEIKRVRLTGGVPETVCRAYPGGQIGASWGDDGTVVFSGTTSGGGQGGLYRVPSDGGGTPQLLVAPDSTRGDFAFLHPTLLPGSRVVLFTVVPVSQNLDAADLVALDLTTGSRTVVIRGATFPHFIAGGYLTFVQRGVLRAVKFDAERLKIRGEPISLVQRIWYPLNASPQVTVSDGGTLAYVAGVFSTTLSNNVEPTRTLAWVDRSGAEQPIPGAPPRGYVLPRISPDGQRVALDVRDHDNDIWVFDFVRGTMQQVTFDPGRDSNPLWTPDGTRILFSSTVAGNANVFMKSADGSGAPQRLTTSISTQQYPRSLSSDGRYAVLLEQARDTGNDLSLLDLEGVPDATPNHRVEPLLRTPAGEINPAVSPDGRWLAYASNESGVNEVYVRPFPRVDDGRWVLSSGGGNRPVWRRDGKELFYNSEDALMSVPIEAGTTFTFGKAVKLFNWPGLQQTGLGPTFDVAPDGKRFLMIKLPTSTETPTTNGIVVVMNWAEELKAALK